MYLSQEKIKATILHPDKDVRQRAVEYFSGSFSRDPDVMPLILQAIKKYGREKSYLLVSWAEHLKTNDEAIEWCLKELSLGVEVETDPYNVYYKNLQEILVNADVSLLRKYRDSILMVVNVDQEVKENISEFLDFSDWPSEKLWKALHDFCDRNEQKDELSFQEWSYVENLTRALSIHSHEIKEKVVEFFYKELMDEEERSNQRWINIFMMYLAGELRLKEIVPYCILRLMKVYDSDEDDAIEDYCVDALKKIGTDEVVDGMFNLFSGAGDSDIWLVAADIMETIHTPWCMQVCMRLMMKTKDIAMVTELAMVLLAQLCTEAMDFVYLLVKEGRWDPGYCDLKEEFVWACLLMEKRYPEHEVWEKHARANQKKYEAGMWALAQEVKSREGGFRPFVPKDPRSLEKTMFNIQRVMKDKQFASHEEANKFLNTFVGKPMEDVPAQNLLEAAQDMAYKAFEATEKSERIRLATQAIELCPDCADAFLILSEEEQEPLASLMYARKALTAAEAVLGEKYFKENVGNFWGLFETRPYMRARFNLADLLWVRGQSEEALEHYRGLLKLNPNDNQGVRYTFMYRLLENKKYDEIQRLIDEYKDDPCAEWLYTKVFVYFKKYGPSFKTIQALDEALRRNSQVGEYLSGKNDLPVESFKQFSPGSKEEAIIYCQEYGDFWWQEEDLMQWFTDSLPDNGFSYQRVSPKVGRNESCPCGSGKKYKKCCGL